MSSKIEMVEKNQAKITLSIPAERFEEGMNYSYNKNKNRLKLPGFRAGKVPRALAEKQYGPEIFLDDAVDFCFPDAYEEAKKTLEFEPVSRPQLDIEEYSKETGAVLSIIVWIKPEVTLGEYKGLSYEDEDIEISDEEIQEEIDKEREKNSRVISVADRPVKNGDTAVIDFEGFIDGEAFEGGKGEGFELVIGSKSFIDTFEEQLIGKNIGDDVEVNVVFPENYGKQELQNKPALFKVHINDITEKELPEMDDEFAQDISEFDTFDEYKNSIKEKLISRKEQQKEQNIEDQLIKTAVENAQCDIPDVMFENQMDQMVQEMAGRVSRQGIPFENFLQFTGQTLEDFREGYREAAQHNVKARLILEAVAKAENIEPTEEEIDKEITRMAESYGIEEDKLKAALRDEDIKGLKTDLKTQKALKLIVENSVKK